MRQANLFFYFLVIKQKMLLLILGLFCSFVIHCQPSFAQPTESLQATYYDTHNRYTSAGASFSGNVILSELVAIVDDHQKNPNRRGDYWSVLIEGFILAPTSGNYQFETYSDDGVRVHVNNQLVINNWTNHATTRNTGSVTLQSGWHPIRIAMYEWGGYARLTFKWRPPNQSVFSFPPAENLSASLPDTTVPTLSDVSISSDNSTSSKAVPDDVVSLTFTASETISTPTVTFSSGGVSVNGVVSVQNTSANTWTASFTANINDTAGPLTYSICLLYTSPSPRDRQKSRMPSSA